MLVHLFWIHTCSEAHNAFIGPWCKWQYQEKLEAIFLQSDCFWCWLAHGSWSMDICLSCQLLGFHNFAARPMRSSPTNWCLLFQRILFIGKTIKRNISTQTLGLNMFKVSRVHASNCRAVPLKCYLSWTLSLLIPLGIEHKLITANFYIGNWFWVDYCTPYLHPLSN